MKTEQNYDFRKRLDIVHKSNRRDVNAVAAPDETVIDEQWVISYPAKGGEDPLFLRAAQDLQDYFLRSMNLSLKLAPNGDSGIVLKLAPGLPSSGSFELKIEADKIIVSGQDPRGVFCGTIHLEDILNFREAPFLKKQTIVREKLVTPRIVHSGWGIELFPESHLNAIAHAGFDAIVVFVTGINRTNVGPLDITNLIDQAATYGLDTILYSYLPCYKHPDDPDAREFFENVYTKLFQYYPKAKGVMLVGESGEFPSKDPATTGKKWTESIVDGIPDPKPSPGWWPCEDYPRWLQMISDAVHKAKPDALVIFNTYNWGWADEKFRKKFLEKFPKDVILQITFEIFKKVEREGLPCVVMDYSISADEPGFYFESECANGHAYGLKLLSTANTAGATWDFGSIGHVPTPQQWIRRFKKLNYARENWGVSRYYDNHHYGWEPSVINDLGKCNFWSPQLPMEEVLEKCAIRDFGKEAAPLMLAAWDKWSEAIRYFTPTNEDQYGPFRVGPSYPFIFHPNITRTMANKEIKFPTVPTAHFGWHIIKTMYQPYENIQQAPGRMRYPVELRSLGKMRTLWKEGLELMEKAYALIPELKKENAAYELNLGKYILCNINTGINMKNWYLLNIELANSDSKEKSIRLLNEIEDLAQQEIANAKSAIPYVEFDSRLGWEPSMEYVTDRWHIEWKLRQMNSMLLEVADYRKILNLK